MFHFLPIVAFLMKLAGHGSTAGRLASVAELNLPRVESFTSVERLQTDLTACFGDPVSRPVGAARIWRVAFDGIYKSQQ